MHNRSSSSRPAAPNIDTAPLRSTAAGTARFRERFATAFAPDYFRTTSSELAVSSVGIGTYLGDSNDTDDAAYQRAVHHAVRAGINLIDTAINYRGQRSERAVGSALQRVFAAGDARRDELVVCSKGGYIPLDRKPPATREEYQAYVKREFLDPQILHSDELVAGGHSLAPRFLRYCLAKSRQNLGLRSIDVYYVHNPEQELGSIGPTEVRARLKVAFAMLEEAASRGEIGDYGCATWDALRVPPDAKNHMSLADLVEIAREVAGAEHHFKFVQLPINVAMLEAVRQPTQLVDGKLLTAVDAADSLGVTVIASATLMQGRLATGLPDGLREHFPECATDGQRAIAFARSLPGVTSSLVGMKRVEHVDENLVAGGSGSSHPEPSPSPNMDTETN